MTSLLLSRVGVLAQHIGVSAPPVTNMPEADWLLTITAVDGAIVETSGGDQNCRPYMANYAAMGLARAFEVTNNTDYLDAAWNWLAWYRDHMDPVTGYVDDYHTVDYLTWTSYGTADSTDAYAGTYLVALWLTYAADQDDTKLALFIDSIPLALTAIESTQQSDGLTYALPTYDVKYLEDNIETLVGCRAAQFLASTSPSVSAAQPDLFSRARATSEALATGIGYMWNHDAGDWDFAIHSNRVFAHNDWADENARRQQIWAVGWNASYSGTADLLLAAYVAAFPDWMTQTASYEPMPTWANAAITGDITDATTVEDTGVAQGRVYPWTCQISGMIIIGLLGFSPSLPYPQVNFPDGSNKIWNNSLIDGGDGIAIGISNYGGPAMALYPLDTGGNYQHMDTPDGNGWDSHWDPFPVIENTYVTFSVFQRIDRLGSGGEAVLKYELYDSGGALVTYGYDVKNVLSGPDFTRWYVTAWIPPGAVTLRPIIGMSSGAIDFAYPQLEVAGSPTRSWNGVPVAPAYVPAVVPAVVVDHFADVQYITDAAGTLTFSNAGFDSAPQLTPLSSAAGTPNIGYDGWIAFIPTKACTVTLDTHGTNTDTGGGAPDTELDIYVSVGATPAVANLLLVARNDDFGDATSQVTFTCQGGRPYFIQVGAHSAHNPSTAMKLTWSGIDFTAPADPVHVRNDLFSTAQEIAGTGQDVPFANYDYDMELGEPRFGSKFRSAWYHFVPTADGSAHLDTQLASSALAGYGTDTYLVLYSGPPGATLADLTQVTVDDDSGGNSTSLISAAAVTAGQHYWVQYTMYQSNAWNDHCVLRWVLPQPPVLLFSDGFDRADGALGGPWFDNLGYSGAGLVIASGKMRSASGVRSSAVPIGQREFRAAWDQHGFGSAVVAFQFGMPVAGADASPGQLWHQMNQDQSLFQLYEWNGSGYVSPAGGGGLSVDCHIELEYTESGGVGRVRYWINGTLALNTTVAPPVSPGTTLGFILTDPALSVDNFVVTAP